MKRRSKIQAELGSIFDDSPSAIPPEQDDFVELDECPYPKGYARSEDPSPKKRRPGAQPNNRNALKHGFYARLLPTREATAADRINLTSVADEVLVTRVMIARTLQVAEGVRDPHLQVALMNAVATGVSALARLLRTERMIDPGPDIAAEINATLAEALRDMRENNDDTSPQPPYSI